MDVNTATTRVETRGILERIREWINWDAIAEKLNLSGTSLTEIGLYFLSGLIIGFLLKRYAHVIFFLILFIAGLVLLDQVGLIVVNVNWDGVEQMLGVHSASVTGSTLSMLWGWVTQNLMVTLGFIGGFLLGIKFG